MKKLTAFLAALALICCAADLYIPTTDAANTIGFQDSLAQSMNNENEPDLNEVHEYVVEGDFEFNVYEDFSSYTKHFNDTFPCVREDVLEP